MTHSVIAVSLPDELLKKIEAQRGDLPRSLVFKRLLESGLKSYSEKFQKSKKDYGISIRGILENKS